MTIEPMTLLALLLLFIIYIVRAIIFNSVTIKLIRRVENENLWVWVLKRNIPCINKLIEEGWVVKP
jgi:hypothetical protein